MEEPIFSPQAWNSSFNDNDASTTLDTSLETENDSIVRYDTRDGHRPKVLTSRSSPGAPLGKDMHNMLGYFDDVDTFNAKVQLQFIDTRGLAPVSQLASYSLPSFSDEETVKSTQRGGIQTPSETKHSSGRRSGTNSSSPPSSTPPVQAVDYSAGRRNARSHTSQGIPTHSLLNALDSIHEDKAGTFNPLQTDLEKENEELRDQLESTRNRMEEMAEQMTTLSIRLDEERNKSVRVNGAINHSPHSLYSMNSYPVPPHQYNGLVANGTHHYLDAMGHTTPDSASMTSMSMTPDPFSPFQRFPSHHQMNHHDGSSYSPSFGFTPPSMPHHGVQDVSSVSQCTPGKPNGGEARMDRGIKANGNMQELQVPVELLVAKTLGARSQDASIAMQQQLKSGTDARKAAIIEAILPHVLRLSDDKHGNFLVQRAVGVDPRVAQELKGNFVALSLSQFGCHVVQRILDEQDLRTVVVEELLTDRVFETLTCRNSIHVWQKVLEINWTDKEMRAKIFSVVNGVMKGRWAETAMQETGSIICQNIFESADVGEKEDCVSEILERLCECAANQWGVWVIQHIIEHGDEDHRRIAYSKLLGNAVALTLSQYGQKAIMSALKSRDPFFIDQFVDILCDRDGATRSPSSGGSPTPSSRRSVLVDIASAPQGVQIVTQLLTSVQPAQRELIIKTVRKNSVFLKGSKAGLRVHQLCDRARAFTGY